MKEKLTKKDLKESKDLNTFKKYLEQRKEESSSDFSLLVQKFNIEKEKLENIRKEIRDIIGDNIEYISTTTHFRVRVIDFLKLGAERIKKATKDNVFYYPVYYQQFSQEKPEIIDIGEIKISLKEAIPEFRKKKFNYTIEFHEALIDYLTKENWEEELKKNLIDYLNEKFSNLPKEERKIFVNQLIEVIINLLKDYYEFFKEYRFNKKEEIADFNSKICEILWKNFETLKELFEKLNITKDYLEDLKDKRNFILDSKIIFLICILGGYIHIGAEYKKFNEMRKLLGFSEIIEAEIPQERFNLFGIKDIESGTLRFLFKDPKPFIYSGIYAGLEEVYFSPINPDVINRIRIVDFYHKLKELNLDEIFQAIYLNKEEFKEVIKAVDYFSYLKGEEKRIVEEIFKTLPDGNKNLKEWIEEFNNKKTQSERTSIKIEILKSKLLFLIFTEYVKNLLFDLKFPDSLKERIVGEFQKKEILESMGYIERGKFGGIRAQLKLTRFSQDDMINLSVLFVIQNENFSPELWKLFPKITR